MGKMTGVCVALVLGIVPILAHAAADQGCGYRLGYRWFDAGSDGQGYFVRFGDPAYIRKVLGMGNSLEQSYGAANKLPPNRQTLIFPASYLADAAGDAVFFIGRVGTRVPMPLDGVWRDTDPLSCLRSLAQAAGLEVAVPKPGYWLLGTREMLEPAAVEVFAYSIDITLQPLQPEAAVAELEHALLATLPVRDVGPRALLGLGYYWIPGEPDTLLVVATHGANTNPSEGDELGVLAYKVRVHRDGGRVKVECLWGPAMGVSGQPLPGIQEDFNGDGVQDFVFPEAGDRDRPDVIVSGADGSTLAEVSGGSIAVQKGATGAKLFAVDWLWGKPKPEGHAQLCQYSAETKKIEAAPPEVTAQAAGAAGAGGFKRHSDEPVDVLAEALGRPEAVRVYVLPGFETRGVKGAEYVRVHSSSVWGWFVNHNVKRTMDNPPPEGLAVHVLLRYLSPTYLKEREKERAVQRP
jgi:hypothetical protein